jgi:opacity protein-like surface antigen
MFARYKSGRDGAHTVEQRENAANKLNKILYSDDVPAVAKDGYYIGAKFNMDFLSWKNEYDYKGWASQPPTDSFDESLSGGSLSFGMYGKGAWRYEMEFAGGQGYSESADGVSFSLNKMSLAANIIKDFPSTGGSSLTPYIGVGAGVANLSVEMDMHTNDSQSEMYFDGGSEKQSKLGFDWRVLAGLGLKLSESWTADLGFRYEGLGSIEYSRPVILDPIVGSPETTEFTNKISPVAKTVYVGIRADL